MTTRGSHAAWDSRDLCTHADKLLPTDTREAGLPLIARRVTGGRGDEEGPAAWAAGEGEAGDVGNTQIGALLPSSARLCTPCGEEGTGVCGAGGLREGGRGAGLRGGAAGASGPESTAPALLNLKCTQGPGGGPGPRLCISSL